MMFLQSQQFLTGTSGISPWNVAKKRGEWPVNEEIQGHSTRLSFEKEYCIVYIWLVVWNMAFMTFHFFPYIGNVIIPFDELHHFSEGRLNHQPDIKWGFYPKMRRLHQQKRIATINLGWISRPIDRRCHQVTFGMSGISVTMAKWQN